MVYLITYDFPEKDRLPDEEFFEIIDSLGHYSSCLENSIFVNAAYLSRGIMEELAEYIQKNRGRIIVTRVTKDFAAKLREPPRKFLKQYWSRIPEISDLGRLPEETSTVSDIL